MQIPYTVLFKSTYSRATTSHIFYWILFCLGVFASIFAPLVWFHRVGGDVPSSIPFFGPFFLNDIVLKLDEKVSPTALWLFSCFCKRNGGGGGGSGSGSGSGGGKKDKQSSKLANTAGKTKE